MGKVFIKRKIEFSEYGNEPVARYVFYFLISYFVIAIPVGIILSQIFKGQHTGAAVAIAATFLAAHFACSRFVRKHERILSKQEYKRLFWFSFLFNSLIQVIFLVLFAVAWTLTHNLPDNVLAVLVIAGLVIGVLLNLLFIYLGYKLALKSATYNLNRKAEETTNLAN